NSSAYKYQDDNKDVKFLNGGLSIRKTGFEAKLDVVNLEINSLGLKTNLGINTSTGVSISNNSIKANIGGIGAKFGKEIGISTSIGGISIDIGTLIDRNPKTKRASRRIKDAIARNGMNVDMFNKDPTLLMVVYLAKTSGLISKKGALPNTTDINIKPGKEIDINTSIGDELSNFEDSFNTITGVACSNESLKDDITSCDMKVGNETGINKTIEDESHNIKDIINPIMDVLNSNKNLDTIITDLGTKIMKEIDTNMHIGDVPFNIEDLTNTFTSVVNCNESIMTNIKDYNTKVKEKIDVNTHIVDILFNNIRNIIYTFNNLFITFFNRIRHSYKIVINSLLNNC
ncbi:34115_t:CDS:1, partial [Gigaspora margarita]